MTWYRQIDPQQEPFDGGLDEKNRAVVIFNVLAIKSPSNTFIEELLRLLEGDGVGTRNVSLFATSKVALPDGSGPYLSIVETGGAGPLKMQDPPGPSEQRPTAKLSVHAATYVAARTMARAAYDALAPVRNETVTP
jgi:hypothetical protein